MSKLGERLNLIHVGFIGKGILVGLLSGLVVSSFRLLIERSLFFWRYLYAEAHYNVLWLVGIILLLLMIGLINIRLTKQQPHIMGSGIPEVETQLSGNLKLQWWPILWRKFIGGALAIGSGLFLGREGPSIQLGSSIGQGVASGLKEKGTNERVLIASGAASGLAAAFNAPIAGTMFVLEEIYHNFSPLVWMTSLAGALSANFISSNIFGLTPVLHLNYTMNFPLRLYWHLLVLGIILGGLGIVYQKVLLAMPTLYRRFKVIPRYADGLIPLLLVIPIGYLWPDTLGGGNSLILSLAKQQPTALIVFGLLVLRFIFSMISYGSGLPGGIFLPILTLGALIGDFYGVLMANLGLLPRNLIMNLVIFAMAGYFAGIGKAPFTAMLLITEMVGTLEHLMPLAVVSLVAYLVVDILGGAPIYESLAERMQVNQPHLTRSGHHGRLEVPVFEGTAFVNAEVRDIAWPRETLLVSIRRGEKELIPKGDTEILAGDTLIVLTDHNRRAQVKLALKKLSVRH
ncbi:ClC family H(+)/Cl(-) exchange transporter [Lapidilactobacillus bayanensis]|uniref:ClC family H(+)/Cl(-) exchange transporter n=1 Tax=Lapidilactobacillus bayanensis TaxID=2485998 RepID=UPI000F77618B|nr:ClC family H(+)/Cl(-) exchange transporter [Lapidilactobacillus bayanensis]